MLSTALRVVSGHSVLRALGAATSTSCCPLASIRAVHAKPTQSAAPELDKIFPKIELEMRGHDKAVLKSYTTFLQTVCHHLSIECSGVEAPPYIKWIIPLLRAKFAKKKNQLHYETRTHIRRMSVAHLTGSTASTFLEYIQRNIPEGVAMRVTYTEAVPLPTTISDAIQRLQLPEKVTEGTVSASGSRD